MRRSGARGDSRGAASVLLEPNRLQTRAREIVRQTARSHDCILSLQTLCEFFHSTTRKGKLTFRGPGGDYLSAGRGGLRAVNQDRRQEGRPPVGVVSITAVATAGYLVGAGTARGAADADARGRLRQRIRAQPAHRLAVQADLRSLLLHLPILLAGAPTRASRTLRHQV